MTNLVNALSPIAAHGPIVNDDHSFSRRFRGKTGDSTVDPSRGCGYSFSLRLMILG